MHTDWRICEGCWGSGRDKTMPDGRCDRCHGEGEIEVEIYDQDEDEAEEYPAPPKGKDEKDETRPSETQKEAGANFCDRFRRNA